MGRASPALLGPAGAVEQRGEPLTVRCDAPSVAAMLDTRIQEMPAMPGSRLHPITIRLPTPIWKDVEKAAKADRRPVASYLKLVMADAIAAQSAGSDSRLAA